MSPRNDAALDFLRTRRSCPAKMLTPPVPDREALREILALAARSPDHGKLEPWRFVVLDRAALARLTEAVAARGAEMDLDEAAVAKAADQFANAHLAVCVVASPVDSPKIPAAEQYLSAGAVCLALLNAALAAGWGANWLTGWPAHDRALTQSALGLTGDETVAGFVHIGTAARVPPERPRPDVEALTTWPDA